MIGILTQMNFRPFGQIVPDRSLGGLSREKGEVQTLQLNQGSANVYVTKGDTWVRSEAGPSLLSVSLDGKKYVYFHLDKTLCLKPGIWFCVSSFRDASSVQICTQIQPELRGTRELGSMRVDRKTMVEGLYSFSYHEEEQGFLYPGTVHPTTELLYVDQGSVHSVVEGQDQLLNAGDIAVYGPSQWHMLYSDVNVAPRFLTISFDLAGSELMPILDQKFEAPQPILMLLQTMCRERELMDEYSEDLILSELNVLLLMLARHARNPQVVKLQTPGSIHNENAIVRKAQIFITSHIREKLSVPMVAQHVDVSPSYLTALFHKNLQISPGEYIRRIKLQESKQMIRENKMNFTEIASALQYSTVHHFSRQFKEKFGITPTEYAKSVR